MYFLFPKDSRSHYKSALRAFRRAHNRSSYIKHLRRRGVAVLEPQASLVASPASTGSGGGPPKLTSVGSGAGGGLQAATDKYAAEPDLNEECVADAGGQDEADDAEGLDGVVRLPFALASKGAFDALRWLAQAVEEGMVQPTSHPAEWLHCNLVRALEGYQADVRLCSAETCSGAIVDIAHVSQGGQNLTPWRMHVHAAADTAA